MPQENQYTRQKLKVLTKSMNVDVWLPGTLNQLFIRGSYAEFTFSKK